jgi:bifunctional enzyme CysN/CysC
LDADLAEGERSQTMEMARRYGEVARLLADTGLIVISTTNPFGMAYAEAAQAIRTLVHPTPVISIQMSTLSDEASTNADLVFTGPADFDAATKSILDELRRRGVLVPGLTGLKLLCYRTTLMVFSCSEGILWP